MLKQAQASYQRPAQCGCPALGIMSHSKGASSQSVWQGGKAGPTTGGKAGPTQGGKGQGPEEAKLGPLWVCEGEGSISAAESDTIFQRTGCRVAYRSRKQWGKGRMLVVSGPVDRLVEAKTLAIGVLEASLGREAPAHRSGGGGPSGSATRLAAGQASLVAHPGNWEDDRGDWWRSTDWQDEGEHGRVQWDEWGVFIPYSHLGWSWDWGAERWSWSGVRREGELEAGPEPTLEARPEGRGEVEAGPDPTLEAGPEGRGRLEPGPHPTLEAGPEVWVKLEEEAEPNLEAAPKTKEELEARPEPKKARPGTEGALRVYFHTFGVRQFAADGSPVDAREVLTREPWRLCDPEQRIVLDCTTIAERFGRTGMEKHIGSSDAMVAGLARTREMGGFLAEFRRLVGAAERRHWSQVEVVCFCNWGKHRSVGVATCLYLLSKDHLGLDAQLPIHHHSHRWSKKGCGQRPCASCDELHSPAKVAAIRELSGS